METTELIKKREKLWKEIKRGNRNQKTKIEYTELQK